MFPEFIKNVTAIHIEYVVFYSKHTCTSVEVKNKDISKKTSYGRTN